ncbi:F0F1 ATP synthase subunit B [Burkholderia sp. Bp9017]|uniref:F0F1 ATP synthase subunit delta n=1 Tax=Burkholderia TaxID=32008 RepID=UPI000F5DC462|nr:MULTISPECIES: F0F1 ATP synthase subunit delta [Burkholderia]MBY4868871.1 F0F1 ATP synthase subunit delta [Burkholderia anthina]RQZ26944.1 F0F1 ATP synthase subunit B [Burkholderia sp. Bp9017]
MRIDWSTLILQTINVLVLVWLLSRFLFKPVSAIIAARQEAARKLIDAARDDARAASDAREAAQAELARVVAARADALKEVAGQAAAEKVSLLAQAQAEAEQLRDAAAARLESERRERTRDDARRATRLALDIAARLFTRLPEPVRVTGFIDGLAGEVAKLPESVRSELGAGNTPLQLITPRALDAQEIASCRAALSACLGRPVELAVRIDASLIAGLELDAAHARVRNSLKQDLEHIEAVLLNDDEASRPS